MVNLGQSSTHVDKIVLILDTDPYLGSVIRIWSVIRIFNRNNFGRARLKMDQDLPYFDARTIFHATQIIISALCL